MTYNKQTIALYGEASFAYVQTLLYFWQKGFVTALCPMREPHSKIKQFLRDINCAEMIVFDSEHKTFCLPGIRTRSFQELSIKNENAQFSKRSESAGVIVPTSGSQGLFKNVLHKLWQHVENARSVNERLEVSKDSKWLVNLPIYHVSGFSIVVRCLLSGAETVFASPQKNLAETIVQKKISHMSAVYAQLSQWLKDEEMIAALQGLKALVVGGGPVSASVLKKANSLRLPIYVTYGMSEFASQITLSRICEIGSQFTSSGYLLRGRKVKVDEKRCVWVSGEMLFKGYVRNGEVDSRNVESGWFKTGDLGVLTGAGELFVLGRKDNMFISGGENVYPEEIENALLSFPKVEQAVVLARPDTRFGTVCEAHIFVSDKSRFEMSDLRLYLTSRLAKFKIPKTIYIIDKKIAEAGFKLNRWKFLKNQKNVELARSKHGNFSNCKQSESANA